MYIRLTTGRDRGEVVDMLDESARAMLADGRALPIDFSEPDALGKRTPEQMAVEEMHKEPCPPAEVAAPGCTSGSATVQKRRFKRAGV